MLPEKPWKPDAVLRLGGAICMSLCVGMVAIASVGQWLPNLPKKDSDLLIFCLGMVFFQLASFGWMHFFLRSHESSWREAFGFQGGSNRDVVVKALIAALVVLPSAVLLGKLSEWALLHLGFKVDLQLPVKMIQNKPPAGHLLLYALGAIIVAPVSEEMLFRGILYPTLKRTGHPQVAVWVSALLFASTHSNLMALVPLTFLALVLTWLYERTGNLLAPILTHVLFNAVNFAVLIIQPSWMKTH